MLTRRDALILGASTMALPATATPKLITRRALPIIGMGTWQTFDVADASVVKPVLDRFVELGGKLIDSSPMYGRSESVIGVLAENKKLFLATKVWTFGKAAGIAQMNESLRKMRATSMDLMQVHNLLDVDTHLATLNEWKRDGRVKNVGVTHYTASAHDDVERVLAKHKGIDFVQINYSVAEREAERRLLAVAKERGVAVIANRPFAGGEVFAEVRKKPLPEWAREIDCTSWAQLLLKFVVSHPSVTFAIPATSKVKHLEDNMGAATGRLPDEAMRARIAAAALA